MANRLLLRRFSILRSTLLSSSSSTSSVSSIPSSSSSSSSSYILEPSRTFPFHRRSFHLGFSAPAPLRLSRKPKVRPRLITEDEFHRLADETIQDLQEKFEEYGDSVQVDGFDIDYGNQVLTLKLGDLGTYVLNKQTPNRQLWLSSPVSGPSRFDWDQNSEAWVYRRTKVNLLQLFESELERLCGEPITLS
ncbi:hypothetical protein Syun_027185 [Stephania yunnanensis]|uniref:ferroxidase n=1 Tax=Stephania yunnanensis TaxID=152371 RepID=A0AAP0ENZ9_9MAGN